MKITKILFPTDFSQHNDAALKVASTLASESGATLHILHVYDVRDFSAMTGEASYLYVSSWHEELAQLRKQLLHVVPCDPSVAYEHHCLPGVPADEIVAFATEKRIELIVMASHGRTGLSRLLMGSVAEGVLRRAPCPVLVVKQPASTDENHITTPAGAESGTFS